MPNGQSYILWACRLVPLTPVGHSMKKCVLLDCHIERDVGGKAKVLTAKLEFSLIC